MKQNKDREEFEKIVGGYCWYQDGGNGGYSFEEVWSWIQSYTQKKVEESYKKGWKAGNKIAHPTKDGYCCACDYDIAVMEGRISDEREKTLKEVREIIEITKQNYAYNSHGGRALKELLSKIIELKEE